jgi:hypothetical protein
MTLPVARTRVHPPRQLSFILAALLVKRSTVVAQILDCSSEMTIRYLSRTYQASKLNPLGAVFGDEISRSKPSALDLTVRRHRCSLGYRH